MPHLLDTYQTARSTHSDGKRHSRGPAILFTNRGAVGASKRDAPFWQSHSPFLAPVDAVPRPLNPNPIYKTETPTPSQAVCVARQKQHRLRRLNVIPNGHSCISAKCCRFQWPPTAILLFRAVLSFAFFCGFLSCPRSLDVLKLYLLTVFFAFFA